MRFILLALSVSLIAGCGDSRIKYAQESVLTLLNDPHSAVFRDDKVIVGPGKKFAVCGSVNAKNRMGGYAGFRQYIFDGLEAQILNEENASDFAGKYLEICTPHRS